MLRGKNIFSFVNPKWVGYFILSFVLLLKCGFLLAQSNHPEEQSNVSPKMLSKLYEQAEEAFYNENYRKAMAIYQKLVILSPEDSGFYSFQISLCYLYANLDNKKALNYFDLLEEEFAESFFADAYFYNLAMAYHINHRFEDAIQAYNKVLTFKTSDKEQKKDINHRIEQCKIGKELVNSSSDVEIKNLGDQINCNYRDYKPVISADESVLIYTSRRPSVTGDKVAGDGRYYEDIFIARKNDFGYWTDPKKLSETINTPEHEASIGLSPDGRELLLFKGMPGSASLYISTREGAVWLIPQKLSKEINAERYLQTSASMSQDRSIIYFTSNRPGGYGGLDIYKSEKQPDGNWGKSVNLGNMVNTEFDEESPFIHPDGLTLYFSSKGHNSMGGYDIFKTILTEGKFSKAENLGFPINSATDDLHFVLTANGKNGYFSSARSEGYGEQDIYKVELQKETPLTLIKGVMRGEDAGQFLQANIRILSKEDNLENKYSYTTDPYTGEYLLVLPPGKNYDLLINATGFQPYVVAVNVPGNKQFNEMYQEVHLRKINAGGVSGQQITVLNTYKDALDTTDNSGRTSPEPDYLEAMVRKIMENTDSASSENKKSLLEDINKVSKITGQPIQELNKAGIKNAVTEAITGTVFFTDDTSNLKEYVIGDDTTYIVSPDLLKPADPKDATLQLELITEAKEKKIAEMELQNLIAESQKNSQNKKPVSHEEKPDSLSFESKIAEKLAEVKKKETAIAEKESKLAEKDLQVLKSELDKTKVSSSGNVLTDKKNKDLTDKLEKGVAFAQSILEEKKELVDKKAAEEKEIITTAPDREATLALAEKQVVTSEKLATEKEIKKLESELKAAKEKPSNNKATKADSLLLIQTIEAEIAKKKTIVADKNEALAQKQAIINEKKEIAVKKESTASIQKSADSLSLLTIQAKDTQSVAGVVNKEIAAVSKKTENAKDDASAKPEIKQAKEEANVAPSAAVKKPVYEHSFHFEFDKSTLSAEFNPHLNEVITRLKECTVCVVEIAGHTDSQGPESYNLGLSKRRANSIASYLEKNGIAKNRMIVAGFGESRPVAPNANPDGTDNKEGRKQNRRTEISVR